MAGQATSFAAAALAYKNAYLAANDPEQKNKGKTIAKNTARQILRDATAALAKIIEATATVTPEQKSDLGLSVRTTPAPTPPPGKPVALVVTLDGDGSLDMKWKCPNPRTAGGTMYQVFRKCDGEADFTYLGGSGQRKYRDESLPLGATGVVYKIQAQRSTTAGPWGVFNVNFGKVVGGGMTASVSQASQPKLAA